jgi:hypothetical protein
VKEQTSKTSFGSGEISEDLYGRFEYRVHQTGLALCRNLVVKDGGGLTRRPPTEWVNTTVEKSRLIPMQIGARDAYVIELVDGHARFYRDTAAVKLGNAVYQANTPYVAADFDDLWWQRVGNLLWITHPARGLWQLRRIGSAQWQSTEFAFRVRPFADENVIKNHTISTDNIIGNVTLTAHGFNFGNFAVGEQIKFRDGDQRVWPLWQPDTGYGFGAYVVYNSRLYRQMNNAAGLLNSGTSPPVHEDGRVKAHGSGCTWLFIRQDFGIAEITAVAPGGATASALVKIQIPEEFSDQFVPGDYDAGGSWRWSEQAFSDRNGWPSKINLHQNRMYLWRGPRFWASTIYDYTDFTTGQGPDKAFSDLLGSSTGMANDVQWVSSGKTLFAGTSGEEYSLQGSSVAGGISAQTLTINPATTNGNANVRPVRDRAAVLHINKDATRLLETLYNYQIDDFDTDDRSLPSEHLTQAGVTRMAFARDPRRVVWMIDRDGQLIGFTYNPKQEIWAWHLHPMTECKVLDICVIPNHLTAQDDLYLKTCRMVCGRAHYFVERMLPYFVKARDTDPTKQPYLDCQRSVEKCGVTSVSGLAYLKGALVGVVSDKGDEGLHTIDERGCISLDATLGEHRDRVTVGFPIRAHARLLPSAAQFPDGAGEARLRVIRELALRAIGLGNLFVGDISEPDLAERVTPSPPVPQAALSIASTVDNVLADVDWSGEDFLDLWTDDAFALEILATDRVIEKEDP